MAKESKSSRWPVIGIVVAIIGIGIPIVWDIFKTQTVLSLDLVSKSALVSKAEDVDGLKILFKDQIVENLTR